MTEECQHGYHEACSGAGYDFIESAPMPCPCPCHDPDGAWAWTDAMAAPAPEEWAALLQCLADAGDLDDAVVEL